MVPFNKNPFKVFKRYSLKLIVVLCLPVGRLNEKEPLTLTIYSVNV